jgi:hypothetical protein
MGREHRYFRNSEFRPDPNAAEQPIPIAHHCVSMAQPLRKQPINYNPLLRGKSKTVASLVPELKAERMSPVGAREKRLPSLPTQMPEQFPGTILFGEDRRQPWPLELLTPH